jgi:hypothetical protein
MTFNHGSIANFVTFSHVEIIFMFKNMNWEFRRIETRVLDPMPKLHISSLTTLPYVPNKETCCRAGKGDLLHNSGQH